MRSIRLPSEAGINAAYDQGRSVVIALIQATVLELAERIQTLEDQLAKNSSNSGKPPSSDGYEKPAEQVEPANKAIKEHLTYKTSVEHFDETGLRAETVLHWLHVSSTNRLTYYWVHKKRGKEGMDALGILPNFCGRAIHDGLPVYSQYSNCKHGLCNAHHLKSLDFLEERYPQKWVAELKELILEIKATVDQAKQRLKTKLSPVTIKQFTARYDVVLRKGFRTNPPLKVEGPAKRGHPKQSYARNLLSRLSGQKEAVLAFTHDFNVPFDNNQAERDIRMMKVRQKVSGCFRSQRGAEIFCAIRGHISTARKNHRAVLDVPCSAFDGHPFIPAFVLQPS
jgi:transposase